MTLLRIVGRSQHGKPLGEYRCECGSTKIILVASVKSGNTLSCGCFQRELTAERSRRRHYPRRPLAERFWEKVDKEGPLPPQRPELGPCWIWTCALTHGYGTFTVEIIRSPRGTVQESAHRVAWRLLRGEIPFGIEVLHHCDVPACCNPAHLFLGTQADNIRDMIAKGRAAPPERTKHVGVEHGRAKLDDERVLEIRERHRLGQTVASLARQFGVSGTTVSFAVRGKTWAHVRGAG